ARRFGEPAMKRGASLPGFGSHYSLGTRPEDGLASAGRIKSLAPVQVLIGSPNECIPPRPRQSISTIADCHGWSRDGVMALDARVRSAVRRSDGETRGIALQARRLARRAAQRDNSPSATADSQDR